MEGVILSVHIWDCKVLLQNMAETQEYRVYVSESVIMAFYTDNVRQTNLQFSIGDPLWQNLV